MIICKKCNYGYDEKFGVCPKCGTPYEPYIANELTTSKKSSGKLITIISISAVVLIGMVIALIMVFSQPSNKTSISEQISLGEKYLAEENYEEAIVAFKKAIEIEPNSPEPYIKLANAYIAKGDVESAISTLQEGYEKTQSATIKAKLDSLAKVESETSEVSVEESKNDEEEERIVLENYAKNELITSGNTTTQNGFGKFIWKVNQYKVDDFNKDGSYELVVQYYVTINQDYYIAEEISGVYLSIFKCYNGSIKEYKTYDTLGDNIQLAGGEATPYGLAQELYVDSESNNLGIITLSHGNNLNQTYERLYCELSENGFSGGLRFLHNEYIDGGINSSFTTDSDKQYYGIKFTEYGTRFNVYSFYIADKSSSDLDEIPLRVAKDDYISKMNSMKKRANRVSEFIVNGNYVNQFNFDDIEFVSFEEYQKRYKNKYN